jgi:hypothetical protein
MEKKGGENCHSNGLTLFPSMLHFLFLLFITFALRADTNANTAEADFFVESFHR